MTLTGRSVHSNRPMARRLEVRPRGSGRRIVTIVSLAALSAVALIGAFHPLTLAGGAQPSATDVLGASSGVGSVWNTGDATGGLNLPDLIAKGTIVLAPLFITLRVLGRAGAGTSKRGGRLEVLESRPLAAKASLHLVAIGDRRLVVGLTPSGMVSLAELDAAELETEEAAAAAEDPAARVSEGAGWAGRGAGGSSQSMPGSVLNSGLGVVDAFAGRLATLLNGSRVR